MGDQNFCQKRRFLLFALAVFQLFFMLTRAFYLNETNKEINSAPVSLTVQSNQVVIDNGIVRISLSSPGGLVTSIEYNGVNNLLATSDADKDNSGYWDCNWSSDTGGEQADKLLGTQFKIISNTPDQVEVSFIRTWDNVSPFAMNVDKRFIMLRGVSGFYTFAIWERLEGWTSAKIDSLRIVFKLKDDVFKYMAISDQRQRVMPTAADRIKGTQLEIREAVRLVNPADPSLNGEVDDKYQYSSDNKDSHLHGWIADNPATGFWMITPSDEFRLGGPFRQDLTSHVSATTLSIFVSSHYADGDDSGIYFAKGEPWKKVYGPVFIYLNSVESTAHRQLLWQNAKSQMSSEMNNWPYNFPASVDYLKRTQRGIVTGQLQVLDKYINKFPQPAAYANVGLALPGDVGSWETENKGYQFWTQTDKKGFFVIKDVRPGTYNLYAWMPGVIGDYKYNYPIEIKAGGLVKQNDLVFEPPRNGPTIWEIGIPDRVAAEFYVPDVNPYYVNHLYSNFDKFRQYGLWQRYTDLYQETDLTFTVGLSDYRKDWFYAHVPRRNKDGTLTPTTWSIIFQLNNVTNNQNYTLRLAFASATYGKLRVAVNNEPSFLASHTLGRDNAIARHGIHGLYNLLEVQVWGSKLVTGSNTIHLSQDTTTFAFNGFMYDYIRFEGPPE